MLNNNVLRKSFIWMFIGLVITCITSAVVGFSPVLISTILNNFGLVIILSIIEIALVICMGLLLNKVSAVVMSIMFILYSFITGLTLSSIFITYDLGAIFLAFFVAAIFFLILAIVGYTTKKDLSNLGLVCIIALVVLIITELILMFINVPFMNMIIAGAGVLIFAGLTMYDMQKIKERSGLKMESETENKLAVWFALGLYLDFINIFLHLLQLLGNKD